jgi:hypothetical protein
VGLEKEDHSLKHTELSAMKSLVNKYLGAKL